VLYRIVVDSKIYNFTKDETIETDFFVNLFLPEGKCKKDFLKSVCRDFISQKHLFKKSPNMMKFYGLNFTMLVMLING